MIRTATLEDIPAITGMGAKFHAQAQLPFPYEPDAFAEFAQGLIEGGTILITDAGMIGGVVAPAFCGPSYSMAVELFWWAERDGLALLKAFEGWAADQGANEVRLSTLAALPRADALVKRKGYAPNEISYRKVI
jgi:GNAT superfamily N-acetyltransferase